MPRLFVMPEKPGDQPLELNDHLLLVGRTPENQLQIEDTNISKHHALLVKIGDTYQAYDLHSINGTFINDQRITTAVLKDGDLIRFGMTTFRFVLGADRRPPALKKPGELLPRPLVTAVPPPPKPLAPAIPSDAKETQPAPPPVGASPPPPPRKP